MADHGSQRIPGHPAAPPTQLWRTLGPIAALAALGLGLVGCTSPDTSRPELGPYFQPRNFYARGPRLPQELRRVAVLPLTGPAGDPLEAAAIEALQPVIYAELGKAGLFEVVAVSPDQLQEITGKSRWTAEEALPKDFLARLRRHFECDGVLFCRLTHYHAYQPVAIGWDLKLVECPSAIIRWAADEVFDAGNPLVINAARRYFREQLQEAVYLAESQNLLSSPKRLGHYSLAALFATVPPRDSH